MFGTIVGYYAKNAKKYIKKCLKSLQKNVRQGKIKRM